MEPGKTKLLPTQSLHVDQIPELLKLLPDLAPMIHNQLMQDPFGDTFHLKISVGLQGKVPPRIIVPLEPHSVDDIKQFIPTIGNYLEVMVDGQMRSFYLNSPRLRLLHKSNICAHCGVEGTWKVTHVYGRYTLDCCTEDGQLLTIDHIIPKCKGGANTEENYQTLCRDCNTRKGGKYESELVEAGIIEKPAYGEYMINVKGNEKHEAIPKKETE